MSLMRENVGDLAVTFNNQLRKGEVGTCKDTGLRIAFILRNMSIITQKSYDDIVTLFDMDEMADIVGRIMDIMIKDKALSYCYSFEGDSSVRRFVEFLHTIDIPMSFDE